MANALDPNHQFTVVSQAIDTKLVVIRTFGGTVPWVVLWNMITTGYVLKVGYEILATPLTYAVVHWLKRVEGADAFDRHESFIPFSFSRSVTTDKWSSIRFSLGEPH